MTEPMAKRLGSNRLRLSITLAVVSAVAFTLASALAIRDFDDDLRDHSRTVLETSLQSRVLQVASLFCHLGHAGAHGAMRGVLEKLYDRLAGRG